MDYKIDYLAEKDIVTVKMSGRLNYGIAEKYSKEAIKLAHQNKCSKFVFDHSDTLPVGITKIHTSGEELQQFGFKDTDRIAVIISKKSEDSGLLKSYSQNSRMSVIKYFITGNRQKALTWLLETE